MTEMPVVYLETEWEAENGAVFRGTSASGIPPLWFDKREGKTAADNERDLLLSLAFAASAYQDAGRGTAWNLHHVVTEPVRDALTARGQAPLAAGFGPALLEAAFADGLCRHLSLPFFEALKGGALGLPAEIAALLPAAPTPFMRYRHTVGLADALSAADVAAPLHDGLPESLEEVIRVYRPSYFKVKISGDYTENLPRLKRIARLLEKAPDYKVTLDGNEQFADMAAFSDFTDRLRAEPELAEFLERTLWIEQPVRRDAALDPASAPALAKLSAFKPVILDESDGEADALARGLALGYGGVSSKTCKGLFRSVGHVAALAKARRADGPALILSSEDLTTVPVHPLQQDLCLAAALGLRHSERNGHHYILPSGFLSAAEQRDALKNYPSLYEQDADAGLCVRIAEGGFDLSEVNASPGFGSVSWPDVSVLQALSLPPIPR